MDKAVEITGEEQLFVKWHKDLLFWLLKSVFWVKRCNNSCYLTEIFYEFLPLLLCCYSVAKLCRLSATPWTAAHQSPLFLTISQSLLRFMSIESMMLSNHLILCHSLLLLPSIFPSIRVFSMSWLFTQCLPVSGGLLVTDSEEGRSLRRKHHSNA